LITGKIGKVKIVHGTSLVENFT